MSRTAFRFGPFLVNRAEYRVTREGRPLDLTPKLLDLLLHLADHAGQLVTKDALLDALWADANVTDNALTQAVSELREALGDKAGTPVYIKTVARRGYRFIATLEAVAREDMHLVESMPTLGTGKVDLRAVRALATNASAAAQTVR